MAIFWIDPTSGDDANDGTTKALAVKTFGDVAGLVSSGDTIKIVDGTHDISAEAGTINFSQTAITIESENNNPKTCILDYQNTGVYFDFIGSSADITVDGVQFLDFQVENNHKGALMMTNATNLTLTNNWFIGSTTTPLPNQYYMGVVSLGNNATNKNVLMTGCVVSKSSTSSSGYTRGFFSGNDITTANITVTNLTYLLDTEGGDFSFIGVRNASNFTINITNSIFYAQTNFSFNVANNSGFIGNIDLNIDYSCLYEDSGVTITLEDFVEGSNNISTDPLLVDPDNLIFELQTNSPCIDTGSV